MLTVNEVKNAKPGAKDRKLADAGGLYLVVTPAGGKVFRMKYRLGGVEKKLTFGKWPGVTLQQARLMRDQARLEIAAGKDPAREKRLARHATRTPCGQSFSEIGKEFLEKRGREGLSANTIKKKEWLLGLLSKEIGKVPITDLTSQQMFCVLDNVQQDRRETARRLRSAASEVFNFAIATGRATSNPAVPLQRALLRPQVRHMPAVIDQASLQGLLRAMAGYTGFPSTLGAPRISPHLFQRPGEIRKMQWADLDLANACWSIPAEIMKKRRPHEVPLSRQAIAIIRDMEAIRNGPYVFPAFHNSKIPLSENTVNQALIRLGYKGVMTAHGFRATASSLLNESGKWNSDAIERAMSRQVGSAVSAIYNRTDYWSQRVDMMQWWSDHLDSLLGVEPALPNSPHGAP